jgi:hypothetical protein
MFNNKRTLFLFPVALLLTLLACKKTPLDGYSGAGKKPVYVPLSELTDIKNLPLQPIEATGTIFLMDTLFFMLEQGKGIHVFNLKDSANTVNLTFWKIPAIRDFIISGNRLYADSWRDLVTIDISDLYQIREIGRAKEVFDPSLFPPLFNGPFECVDESKGAVVRWEDAQLNNVLCQTVN